VNSHRVLILGGGFGGLSAAKALKRAPVEVTLVDRRNFHLFQPLLYQVATGSLSPGEIAAPLRSVLSRQKNARVLLGEAKDVDSSARCVILSDGTSLKYDFLIVATGLESFYFGKAEWQEWAPSLKSIEEATAMRSRIFEAFETAERLAEGAERRAWLTFAIVGAGPTGVELAGALAEIAHQTLRHDFRSIRTTDAKILLMDGAPRILPSYPESLAARAQSSLERMGVAVRTGLKVVRIDECGVALESANELDHVPARTVLWAGGVTAAEFARRLAVATGAATDNRGRFRVQADLTIPNHPQICVIGDLALAVCEDGKPLPGVAPVAMQQGAYAARNIVRRLKGANGVQAFHYVNRGDMAVIGRAAAVANVRGFQFWGWPAWLLWLFIHLMYLVEFQSRVVVFVHWAFQYITFNRGARLITGLPPVDSKEGTAQGRTRRAGGCPP
jgi:NADH dehydrogenase